MTREKNLRLKNFKIATRIAGINQEQFSEQVGVSLTFLSRVLHNKKTSRPLLSKIDAFCSQQIEQFKSAGSTL